MCAEISEGRLFLPCYFILFVTFKLIFGISLTLNPLISLKPCTDISVGILSPHRKKNDVKMISLTKHTILKTLISVELNEQAF